MIGSKLAGGNPRLGRVENDYYATAPETTKLFLNTFKEDLGENILEPACGEGHLVEVLKEYFPNSNITSTDLINRGYGVGGIVDFEKKLATTRSRGIDIFMIFQNIPQLENRYNNNIGQEILGNADTKIFMGAGDILTAEYISKYLGVSTVETNAIRKEARF